MDGILSIAQAAKMASVDEKDGHGECLVIGQMTVPERRR